MRSLDRARRLIAEERTRKTGFLNLGNLGLTEVPSELFQLTHLRSLNLGSRYGDDTDQNDEDRGESTKNKLESLPPGIGALRQLTTLSIVETLLGDLTALQHLPTLQTLDCSGTQVTDLAPLQHVPGLQVLRCVGTPVSDLTPLQYVPALQTLRCAGTRVSDLSPLTYVSALQSLDCTGTQISDLAALQHVPSLQSLLCSRTQVRDLAPLQHVPALHSLRCWETGVSDLAPLQHVPGLQTLDCSATQVGDLTPLQHVPALQTLDCSATLIRDLAPLQYVPALQTLRCSSTQVRDLTPLQHVPALQTLRCSSTQVGDLTPLQYVPDLQTLRCSGTQVNDLTPLRHVPALQRLSCSATQVRDLSPLQHVPALRTLSCSATPVSDLTPLRHVPALQTLSCSATAVSDLAPLKHVPALQTLSCSATAVSDLTTLKHVPTLQTLSCSATQVSDLTPLQHVPTLKRLRCSATRVSDLAPVQHVPGLQTLFCSGTQVNNLAPIRHLAALQRFDCSRTPVSDLTALVGLDELRDVAANQCPLRDLPQSLVFKERLTTLYLSGVSVPGLPVEVLSVDSHSNCLTQLRDHLGDLKSGREQVKEAKLVVIGNGRVGKTQVCRRLRNLAYDDTVPSTHGITVTSEPWNGSSSCETLNIWDFGGQDIYHGVHTLFMKTRAVFLIVWHPDFEAGCEDSGDAVASRNYPLPYWLDYVRTLARTDCPVVVVQSRCERQEQEVRRLPVNDRDVSQHRYLKQCWYSAKTERGRGALDDALGDAIDSLREREGISTIGAGRMRVLRQLVKWKQEDVGRNRLDRLHRTITQNEFRSICEEAGGIGSPESLLDYLHNLGVVFYQPALFQERIILDQSWALEAIYPIFDRVRCVAQIAGQGGRFTRSFLDLLVWHDYSDAEQRLFLSLMEACAICFVSRQEDRSLGLETEYIAPDLLPDRRSVVPHLAGRWDDKEKTWRLEYEYPFLHQGLMRALLCDIGARAHEAGVYWKYGAWVYEPGTGCRVLLEQHMHDGLRGRITLRLQGGRHEDLARWLRRRIETRNGQFGHQDLVPTVDELASWVRLPSGERMPIDDLKEPAASEPYARPEGVTVDSPMGGTFGGPTFEKLPASLFPKHGKQVFVSYAWGDDTDAGRQRADLVDRLCDALDKAGAHIHRDHTDMRLGDRISEFMDRLADSDCVIVVVSDKYLRSETCMYELFRIYRNCADDPTRFVRRVIPLMLPDAALDSIPQRLARAKYWFEQWKLLKPEMEQNLEAVGIEVFKKYRLITEFARNTSDMLEHLSDILQPRDFDQMAKEDFRAILAQINCP